MRFSALFLSLVFFRLCLSQSAVLLNGQVRTYETEEAVSDALITVWWGDSMKYSQTFLSDSHGRFSGHLFVNSDCMIICEKTDYLTFQLQYSPKMIGATNLSIDLKKEPSVLEPEWEDLFFAYDSTGITDPDKIARFADYLKKNSTVRVRIVGWALISERSPEQLALQRAENVREELMKYIDEEMIQMTSSEVSPFSAVDYHNRFFRKVEFLISEK